MKQHGRTLLVATALLVSPALPAPPAEAPAPPSAAAVTALTAAAPVAAAPRPAGEPTPAKGSDVVQRTGPGVFAPSTGVWQLRDLPDVRWGRAGDVPVPGDYDGNGRTDVAVWRPSTGVWLLRGLPDARWGRRGDVPVPGDYDGDGRTDVAVWRPSTGVWLLRGLPDARWGRRGDLPVLGDYDGDRRTDVAVWRPSTGVWLLRGLPDVTLGRAGDRPVPADQDGNSTTDVGVWRPSTGEWLRRGLPAVRWGKAGDVPVRVGAPATSAAPFHAVVTAAPARRMRASWRAGCPVPIRDLRLLTVTHVGFDRLVHRGQLVVAGTRARQLAGVFGTLYAARFPIRRMHLVDEYGADDNRSMSDDNTSAFNCRAVTGRPGVWSQHSYGWAVDVNPFENPYVSGSTVLPPAAKRYADRSRRDPGMIHAGDATVTAFRSIGWGWGGSWTRPKDYQHFSATNR